MTVFFNSTTVENKKHTQKTIREHYTEQWADEIYRVIIEYDTIPIGYAQIYRIQGELFDEYNYHETEEKIYAMDNLSVSRNIGIWESVQNIAE